MDKRTNPDLFKKKFITSGKLKKFGSIFEKWCEINRDFFKKIKSSRPPINRMPWQYNERTLVGMLSGAGWMAGYCTVEEFSDQKGRRKDSSNYYGRCDLGIICKEKIFLFEAKKCQINLGKLDRRARLETKKEALAKIWHSLDKAQVEAGELRPRPRYISRFGLCFVVPRISVDKVNGRDIIKNELTEFLEKIIEKNNKGKFSAVAWYFVHDYEMTKRSGRRGREYYYPGIILIIKETLKRQVKR
ncbi:MAG: hypothetical protein QHH43_05135 [Candidatus Saccharicenans sp.]|jgi:hypothetical protein|nr:hypothetical protein [Candidatus Saccharicenans sp.]MDH7575127.1 hypothetical protein [Candidatus Saccharicenans sp.]